MQNSYYQRIIIGFIRTRQKGLNYQLHLNIFLTFNLAYISNILFSPILYR